MSNQLLRVLLRSTSIPQRAFAYSAIRSQDVVLNQEARDRIHHRIGTRDIVGFGLNGSASYNESTDFPCPAIRFKDNTTDVVALREKEKGDWKNLSMEDKKALYRASFCRTYSEMTAKTGEWKFILAAILTCFSLTGWIVIWMKKCVYSSMPSTITREWQLDSVQRMIGQRQGPVEGVASKWDYEKGEWKN